MEPIQDTGPGISIITVTNRLNYRDRILANYQRQDYHPRELIIVLNNNAMLLEEWQQALEKYSDIKLIQADESWSLGKSLNYGVSKANYDYIAKFDDDDYYASGYLKGQMQALLDNNASVVGKASFYLYFEANRSLAVYNPDQENRFVNYVTGATLLIKKETFEKFTFPERNAGEDVEFLSLCKEKGLPIYSSSKEDFVGIRRGDISTHLWQDSDEVLLSRSHLIAHTSHYLPFISARINPSKREPLTTPTNNKIYVRSRSTRIAL